MKVVNLEWMVLQFECSWYWVGITMGMVCNGAYQHRFYVLVLSRRVLMRGNIYKDRSGRCHRIAIVDRDGWSQADEIGWDSWCVVLASEHNAHNN